MLLKLTPQRRDESLCVVRNGDVLSINGTAYDFSPLVAGATLPMEAIDCKWICGDVERVDGKIVIPILLPCGPNASDAARFPEPITVTSDGEVVLPV